MTTELEQEFFKVFGVQPNITGCNTGFYDFYKGFRYCCDATNCKKCKSAKKEYPKITDRVLLELIFRLIKYEETFEDSQFKNIKELKNYILAKCISIKTTGDKWLARQIQQLFKEEE